MDESADAFARANAHAAAGDADAAARAYRALLAREPGHVGALNNLATLLRAGGDAGAALACLRRALAFGARPPILINLALALLELHRPAEAAAASHQATAMDAELAPAWSTLGGAELACGDPTTALGAFRRALALAPGLGAARFGEAVALLTLGEWDDGWDAYACRWDDPDRAGEQPRPLWTGDAAAGRTLLLRAEQGFGDTIQFARYVPLVAATGARTILQVPRPLMSLLAPLADQVVALDEAAPRYDAGCGLMDLARIFATRPERVPPPAPLAPDPVRLAAWRARLGPATGRCIGLAFAGRAGDADDAVRSLDAAAIIDALAASDAELHLLHPELGARDAALAAAVPFVRTHVGALADFTETAALLAQMDLVVSVDTAVAHLAATLGRPTWILLAHAADFRWLQGRADTPWYPTARLFRQPTPGDWGSVLADVARAVVG